MGNRIQFAGLLCIGLQAGLLPVLAARADDRWGGSIGVTTDYIYRGISYSNERSALQGGVQWQGLPGWSVGAWASTADFVRDVDYELDLHAARAWSLNEDWALQFGIVHYDYSGATDHNYDYDELTASVSFQQRVTASVAWSPNTTRWSRGVFARERQAISYELTLLEPIGRHWSVCAGAGHYDLSDLFDAGYWYWNVGVAFNWESLQVDVLHIDTDATAERLFGSRLTGGRWTAALTWRF
jgi:uncharacterized protein (TIGR02001 family)